MLGANKIKLIRSLAVRKYRKETGLFLAEGHKLVGELLGKFHCTLLAAVPEWLEANADARADEILTVTQAELQKASLLQTPQSVLALFRIPQPQGGLELASEELCLALDGVQDPGNMGTIVRLADWFGIGHIFCSTGTADIFNPKAVQATMGAIARVSVHYLPDLASAFKTLPAEIPVYGTFMDGEDIYKAPLSRNGIIVMGNEGNGISPEIQALVTDRIGIPSWPAGRPTSESLNVAIATAIVCSEFRRRH